MRSTTSLKALAVAGIALLLAACGSGAPVTEGQDAETSAASDDITIGFSISTMQNPFFVSMDDGIKEAAEELGVTVIVSDAADDASKQANDVLNFISQGVDAVVLNPTDSDAIISSVQALNDANIPVLTVDRRANGGEVVTHLGTDNVIAGEIAAKTLFDVLGGTGQVAILEGVPGASPTIDRQTGFDNTLKDYPDIEIVASQTANFQRSEGLSVGQNILQSQPDLTAFLAMNDEMALGAVEAIRSAGLEDQVKVIGIDGGDDAIRAVQDGQLVATIAQQSKLMGNESIKNALAVINGETLPAEQPVDVIVIDANNVSEYSK